MLNKKRIGNCYECGKENTVIAKKLYEGSLCIRCNKKRLDAKKQKKPTGEKALFLEIYNERPHVCERCGTGISGFNVANYHHVKGKGAYPELRMDKTNIVKICFKCHFKIHNNSTL